MSTATQKPAKPAPSNPMAPTVWEEHQENMRRRREAREANRKVLRACLKADVATQLEVAKPVYEWEVSATFDVQGDKGLEPFSKTVTVRAQTEADAWAAYCDKILHWPSPNACEERTIVQGRKVN